MIADTPPARPRRVIIATPSLTGTVDVAYAWSLAETIKMSVGKNVIIAQMFLPQNSLIQLARDELLAIAREAEADDMVWIDADVSWRPEWFFKLLDHKVDIVGGTYRMKKRDEEYPIKAQRHQLIADANGLMQVEGLGFGFLRFSKKVIDWLWDNSDTYWDRDRERRWAFDVRPRFNPWDNGKVTAMGEDIGICARLLGAGFTINLDPTITCDHIGTMKFRGDFAHHAAQLYEPEQLELTETAA